MASRRARSPIRSSAPRRAAHTSALRRLPLGSLRVFVAVAEHLSFTRAAATLGVTVGAASMQVQALEEYLGQQLFRRRGRSVELTSEGSGLLPKLRDGLCSLQDALDEARVARGTGPLRISTLSSFLVQWLMPRLPDFERLHPAIELRIETSTRLADFGESDIHAAIRLGMGKWPGLRADKLLDEWLVPVCTPALLEKLGPIHDQDDLQRYRLLHSPSEPWSAWLLGAGTEDLALSGSTFDDSAAIVRAAQAGTGLALARWSLVADEVAQGHLAVASRRIATFARAYWLVYPPKYRQLEKLAVFSSWLRAQAASFAPPPNRKTTLP